VQIDSGVGQMLSRLKMRFYPQLQFPFCLESPCITG
jgi:hypothetical protein